MAMMGSGGRRWLTTATAAAMKTQPASHLPRTLVKDLEAVQLGSAVSLSGWLQSIRPAKDGLVFVELRDHSGTMQVVLEGSQVPEGCLRAVREAPLESVIRVQGKLVARPNQAVRVSRALRDRVEVVAEGCEVLNAAADLPFNPFSPNLPGEELRLRDRFVDLRRPSLQAALRNRAAINAFLRGHFASRGFTEVETPLLFKSTPEGAREFLVPADDDGYAYALPQSPQQFKQMLMAAGFDRYYQIARCFRNEDLRADRQPEFTQLDVEMAFVEDESCVMAVMEEAVQALMRRFAPTEISGGSFPRLRYAEVMARYGCDKPDTRYPFTIETVKESGDSVTEALDLSTLPSGFDLPTEERIIKRERSLREHSGSTALGRIRSEVIRRIEAAGLQSRYRIEGETGWLWVHRFPLFNALSGEDPLQAGRRFEPLHHPFTAPLPEDAHLLKTDPALVHGQHYDLVWRGVEVGGGSIRIHSPALQEFVLRDVIGLPQSHLAHFDHLLRALRSGCPPHGGMALGLDRLIAMLHGAASIRDVIAFPKNGRGHDLCVNAPSQIKP